MAKVWKEADNQFLKENYLKYSNQELADMFKVTKKSIQGKLRRLGLHRKDDVATEQDVAAVSAEEQAIEDVEEEKPIFRKKRLNFNVPVVAPPSPTKAPYRPVEMTEKRKRAIREFDNAMNILAKDDHDKALSEFNFIKDKFPRELDIVQKAQMWINLITKETGKPSETPEEFYVDGIRYSQRNKIDEAYDCFTKAVELDPEYLDARYNVACIKCRRGEYDQAVDDLRNLAELDERFVQTATQDDDFEAVWENENFIELAMSYLDLEEVE